MDIFPHSIDRSSISTIKVILNLPCTQIRLTGLDSCGLQNTVGLGAQRAWTTLKESMKNN